MREMSGEIELLSEGLGLGATARPSFPAGSEAPAEVEPHEETREEKQAFSRLKEFSKMRPSKKDGSMRW